MKKGRVSKENSYYSALVNAWLNTKLERDKNLLILSAGGIGLLITILTIIKVNSVIELILFIFANLSFLLCLTFVLMIFSRNAQHIEDVLNSEKEIDKILEFLDNGVIFSFLIGVIFTFIIGVNAGIEKFNYQGDIMGGNIKRETTINKRQINESFNKIGKLKPDQLKPDLQKHPEQKKSINPEIKIKK